MQLKKFLMASIVGSMVWTNAAQALPLCSPTFVCFWMDPFMFAASMLNRAWSKKLQNPTYDVHDGLEKIKKNIGMYRDQGECGISATGNSGCDLTTPEQGAAEDAEMAEQEQVIPDSTINIIWASETGKVNVNGQEVSATKITSKKGTFDQVRENVASYIFVSDDDDVNADCACTTKVDGKCDPTECAQQRQNDALFTASLGASARADKYLQEMDKNWNTLVKYVEEINGVETLADFVGKLGNLSVYASSATTDLMALQTHDLRTQSYRNLIFGGINEVDLKSELKQENTNGGNK